MNIKVLLGVVTLLACSAASADELGARLAGGVNRAPAAMLYVAFPLAARHHEGPTFGLRMERPRALDVAGVRADGNGPSVDVPFNRKRRETDTQALSAFAHPGIVIGAIVGAVVVLAAANDSDGGGGGGY